MENPADIQIHDMAEPVLTPMLSAARQGSADFPDALTAAEVLERAVAMTGGLTDFGEDRLSRATGGYYPGARGG